MFRTCRVLPEVTGLTIQNVIFENKREFTGFAVGFLYELVWIYDTKGCLSQVSREFSHFRPCKSFTSSPPVARNLLSGGVLLITSAFIFFQLGVTRSELSLRRCVGAISRTERKI